MTPSIRWRVVCGLSVTMLIFSPTSAFISVDLPTFGRPTIATKPERLLSGVGTGQHRQHRGRRLLLRAPAARAATVGLQISFRHFADDSENTLVLQPPDRGDLVRRKLHSAALQ